jgi:hypothetical protein
MVRRGTPPDFDDTLVEVSNVRIGRVIIDLDQLVDLMEQARDCPHFIELANASIREAEKLRCERVGKETRASLSCFEWRPLVLFQFLSTP